MCFSYTYWIIDISLLRTQDISSHNKHSTFQFLHKIRIENVFIANFVWLLVIVDATVISGTVYWILGWETYFIIRNDILCHEDIQKGLLDAEHAFPSIGNINIMLTIQLESVSWWKLQWVTGSSRSRPSNQKILQSSTVFVRDQIRTDQCPLRRNCGIGEENRACHLSLYHLRKDELAAVSGRVLFLPWSLISFESVWRMWH